MGIYEDSYELKITTGGKEVVPTSEGKLVSILKLLDSHWWIVKSKLWPEKQDGLRKEERK